MKKISALLIALIMLSMLPEGIGGWNVPMMAVEPVIVQIAAGYGHSLALFSDGCLYAWGNNEYGQLGDGTYADRTIPVKIGAGYTAIAAGGWHSLAFKGSALYAWGANWDGQLGDETFINRNTPVWIGIGFTAIAAGGSHSLALKGNALYTWGSNGDGQLGDGKNIKRDTPEQIGTGFTAIAAGFGHSLALRGFALYAWGYNEAGQLGDRTNANRNIPILIETGYSAIAAGGYHSLALKENALYAWGSNEDGQLGDGVNTYDKNMPARIGTGYTAIAAGGCHSLALKGNTLYAWGYNYNGQLGDGTNTDRNTPVRIGSGYTAIAAGGCHSLALKGNTLFAWGSNQSGQLGVGTNTDEYSPAAVKLPLSPTTAPIPGNDTIKVKGVSLSPKSLSLVTGEMAALTATITPLNASNKAVTWRSGNNDIAIVDNNGNVTAVRAGKVTITVTTKDGNKTANCTVAVRNKIPLKSIDEIKTTYIQRGRTYQVRPTLNPSNADVILSFTSSAKEVLDIDSNGLITTYASGESSVTISAGNISRKFTVKVGEVLADSVLINYNYAVMKVGETLQLLAMTSPERSPGSDLTWASSNNAIATVSAAGLLTAMKKGTVKITVTTWNDKHWTSTFYVTD